MNEVMVWTLFKGFKVTWGVAPAAMVTAMVSPTAREMARINAAMIPLNAAGVTTLVITSNFVAPKEYAASRNDLGTARMASSLMDATVGMIIIPKTIEALNALKKLTSKPSHFSITVLINGVTKLKAKYPYTTEGIPANISSMGLRMFRIFSDAYSLK